MSKIDLYRGDCLEVMDRLEKEDKADYFAERFGQENKDEGRNLQ